MNTGVYVFNNMIFDSWLNRKSDEILSKVDRETISNEDMLILILKAQTNHFHHMDDEFRSEFKIVREEVKTEFKRVDKQFEQIEKRFELVDKRFDRLTTIMMWQSGILITLISGLYLKLFLL